MFTTRAMFDKCGTNLQAGRNYVIKSGVLRVCLYVPYIKVSSHTKIYSNTSGYLEKVITALDPVYIYLAIQ